MSNRQCPGGSADRGERGIELRVGRQKRAAQLYNGVNHSST